MNIIDDFVDIKTALQRIKKPPTKIYHRGNLELLSMRKIAIVGSRSMNFYTQNLITQLASKIVSSGEFCVVSGAALGCDITAHKGAYPHTIAVFGNGLNHIYPKENAKTITQIYENSLALSEYEDDVSAKSWQFLERNRIVVGLSEALVVAQANLRSGSLQSARLALEAGIPVYVFPHRMGESDGTNMLLSQNKAKLIDDIDKFVNFFISKDKKIVKKSDKVLEFISKNPDLQLALQNFGDMIYEYELDGKITIDGVKIRIL